MDKENVVNTYNGILAFKRKEILTRYTLMNLKDTILSEISQSQKDKTL